VKQGCEQVRGAIVRLAVFVGHGLGDVEAALKSVGIGHGQRVKDELTQKGRLSYVQLTR
jgi:hypothetical protein